jgi:hypothetical protein
MGSTLRTIRGGRGTAAGLVVSWLAASVLTGCQRPKLSVDDVILQPGGGGRLVACVHDGPFGIRQNYGDVGVRFFADNEEIAQDRTNQRGLAEARADLPTVGAYEARARVAGHELSGSGRVFRWDPQRVCIAVDIDETIATTPVRTLLRGSGVDDSRPIPRSVAVLQDLGRDYQLVYVTARSRFLLEKTRTWLVEQGFPDGPVVAARSIRELFRVESYKRRQIAALRAEWPNLLIGIGDRPSDAAAYDENGMLALALTDEHERFGPRTVVFRDWDAVARFFAAHRAVLTDAARLRDATKNGTLRAAHETSR